VVWTLSLSPEVAAGRSIVAAVPPLAAAPPPSDSHPLALTPTQRVVKKTRIVVVADIEPEPVGTAVVLVASAGNTVAVLLLPSFAEY